MKLRTSILASILMGIPTFAHASGGDVLSLLWLEAGLFVVALIFLITSRLDIKQRVIVFFSYFVSAILVLKLTSKLPYTDNIVFINTVSIFVPIIISLFIWIWYAKK